MLLIHGAWADGSSWSKVIPLLEAKGLHVVSVQIPLTSFADDVAATQRAIALEDGPVLLVGHSYGGAVITEAGNDPKVAGLVYVSAVAPDHGESTLGLISSVATPIGSELRPDKSGFLKLTPKGVAEDFAQDLSAKEIEVLTATQVPVSVAAMKGEVTTPAWKSKPSWYIIAANDRAISPDLEASQAKKNRSDNHHCHLQPRDHAGATVEGRRCDLRCRVKGRHELEKSEFEPQARWPNRPTYAVKNENMKRRIYENRKSNPGSVECRTSADGRIP